MSEMGPVRRFFSRHKKLIIAAFAIYILIVLGLLYFGAGTQESPFVYEVF